MKLLGKMQKGIKHSFFNFGIGLLLLLVGNICAAQTIVIRPNTVISFPKTYNNVVLDMSHGSFILKKNATLTIQNSVITGTLSEDNPLLFNVDKGKLILSKNQVNIKTVGIDPHSTTQSLQYVIQVAMGNVNMSGNTFSIDKPFTAGLLITTASIPTTDFVITKNRFEKFHGVLYLIASDNAVIADNILNTNTYGQIVLIGNNSKIIHNTIFFAGNNRLGNAMDIIDSDNIIISKNRIFTPTCHGIYVLNSHNLTIDSNRISGGITYAMNIFTFAETAAIEDEYIRNIVMNHHLKNSLSNNITITNNYMSQNRFGIAASDVDNLVVSDNYFVQRFEDNDARIFWTNNSVLLQHVTNLTWTNNLYKEAFTQEPYGDNSKSKNFVVFPQTGGVSL